MATGDIRIDALLARDAHWLNAGLPTGTPVEVTYSFMETSPSADDERYLGGRIYDFQPLSQAQRESIAAILRDIDAVSGLTFRQVEQGGMLSYGLYSGRSGLPADMPSDGETIYRTDPDERGADIWLNHQSSGVDQLGSGYGRFLALHETGHALGLKHPGNYSEYDSGPFLPAELDSGDNTLMSYNNGGVQAHLGEFDILALQHLYGPAQALESTPNTIRVTGLESYVQGSDVEDRFFADAANIGNTGLRIDGGAGDDVLQLRLAGQASGLWLTFDGGEGINRLELDATRSQIESVTFESDYMRLMLGEGSDVATVDLVDVTRVGLIGNDLALDLDGNAGQAFRIYQAAFGREPDKVGLGYWIAQRDGGMLLDDIAARFLASDEFQARYGSNLSDEHFLEALYANVLGRQYDEGGFDYWLGELSQADVDRAHVLASFSESTENRESLAAVMGQGVEYEAWLA